MNRTRAKLTEHLGPLTTTPIPRPHTGWIRASREALGMNATQLALQLGINKSGVGRLEEAERTGSIKLDTLRRAAEAMDCSLVYAIVPNGTYSDIVNERVRSAADTAVAQTLHAMALENQAPDADAVERIKAQAIEDLIRRGHVWDH